MKNAEICTMRRLMTGRTALALALTVLLCLGFGGAVMAAQDTGHAEHAAGQAENEHEALHEAESAAAHGEEHSAGEDHGEGHGGGKGWVATDTYRVMNFAVLAIGLFFLLRKPASQALNARIEGIRDELNDLEARKEKAEKELAEYNQKLSLLDQEAEKIVAEYERQGEQARERILEEARSTAQRLEEQAQRNIENEFQRVRRQVQGEVIEKALAKAEEMLKTNISGDDQSRLVDEYLEKVVA